MNRAAEGLGMTTRDYLQLEAITRGQTLDALMEEYRGTETEIGQAIFDVDVEDLHGLAGLALQWVHAIYAPEQYH
jgi:hypothetical protein